MRNRTFGHHYGPWMAPSPGTLRSTSTRGAEGEAADGVAVGATAAMSGRRCWPC